MATLQTFITYRIHPTKDRPSQSSVFGKDPIQGTIPLKQVLASHDGQADGRGEGLTRRAVRKSP